MDRRLRIALESQNPWWFEKAFETGVERLSYFPQIEATMEVREVLLLFGARRTGKSTLVYQIIRSLLERGVAGEAILFMNLDEPFFFSMADDPALITGIVEDHIARHPNVERFYLCIDEVQNYSYWAQAIKTIYDTKSTVKCILTGSTSSLLQRESSRLSGRYFSCTVYPLSFEEYLRFCGVAHPTVLERRQHLEDYLKFGGFPRVVLEEQEGLKIQILKNYYETIYLKDIIFPNRLRNNSDLVDLLYYLISNVGNTLSYNRIADGLQVSTDTVKEYIEYAEDAFLLYTVMKFDYSVKKQVANPKKIYALDTGLVNAVAFTFSENAGKLLENLVYIALRRKHGGIYYHKEQYECDFLVKSGRTIVLAVQVTWSLKEESTRKMEIRGLVEAMDAYTLDEGVIVTASESEELVVDGRAIHVVPLYEWLDA